MSKTKKRLLIYISLEFITFLLLILYAFNNIIYNNEIESLRNSFTIVKDYTLESLDNISDNNQDNIEFYIQDNSLYYGDILIGNGTYTSIDIKTIFDKISNTTDCILNILMMDNDNLKYIATSYLEKSDILNTYITESQFNNLKSKNFEYDGQAKIIENNISYLYYFNSYPIKDKDNNIIGILTISKNMNSIYEDVEVLLKKIIIIIIILLPMFIIGLEILTRRWTKATKKINDYINNINLNNLPDNELIINNKDEFDEIANSINKMVNEMKNSNRLFNEVKVASTIQQKMLSNLDYIKEYINIDLDAKMIPAKEIGGDFYNTFKIDNEHICLCVGDVSGKGVPSAIVMAVISSLIKTFIFEYKDPSIALNKLNKNLLTFDYPIFVTCFLSILNIKTGELIYSNAGHNKPLIISNKVKELDCKANIVLGAIEYNYTNQNYKLKHGNNILIYTDGLTEAINKNNEQYGLNRLIKYIENYKEFNLLDDLYQDINKFIDKNDQFDDMTALLLLYHNDTSISLNNDINELNKLNNYIENNIKETNLINKIQLGLEELFVNIVNYSYNKEDIKVNISYLKNKVKITIIDSGIEFNPITYQTVDTNKSIEDTQIGGLGIHIVKQIFNNIEHHYINNKNILILEKEVK